MATLALACGLLAIGLFACSGDDPPSTADLAADLAFLEDQQGFTKAEVTCVADHARAGLSGGELERFAEDLAVLERTSSMASMHASSRTTLTRAITACAGG